MGSIGKFTRTDGYHAYSLATDYSKVYYHNITYLCSHSTLRFCPTNVIYLLLLPEYCVSETTDIYYCYLAKNLVKCMCDKVKLR